MQRVKIRCDGEKEIENPAYINVLVPSRVYLGENPEIHVAVNSRVLNSEIDKKRIVVTICKK